MAQQHEYLGAVDSQSFTFTGQQPIKNVRLHLKRQIKLQKPLPFVICAIAIMMVLKLTFYLKQAYEERQLQSRVGINKRMYYSPMENNSPLSSIKTTGQSPDAIQKIPYLSHINIFDPASYTRVAQALYKSQDLIDKRIATHKKRKQFMNHHMQYPNVWLSKYNMKISQEDAVEENNDLVEDYLRLEDKYKLSEITTELPMCIISPSYNNNDDFRVQYNLNSIFSQNYSNFQAVIIDDGSTDGTDDVMRAYRDFYNISEEVGIFIFNKERKRATENIYNSAMKYCKPDSIGMILDGDDEILGKNTLKVFNSVYQRKKAEIVYSNAIVYGQKDGTMRYSFSIQYTQHQKENQLYRKTAQKFSHFRSFKVALMKQVKLSDLQTQDGKFFPNAADYATMYPMMELACGHVHWINEYNYLYALDTGVNNYKVAMGTQVSIGQMILNSPAYPCSKKYQI